MNTLKGIWPTDNEDPQEQIKFTASPLVQQCART